MKGKRTTIFFSATKCTLRYDSAIHIEVNACTCIQDEKPFGLFEKINPDEINVYDSTYNYSSHKKNDRTAIINEDENEHLYVASLRIVPYLISNVIDPTKYHNLLVSYSENLKKGENIYTLHRFILFRTISYLISNVIDPTKYYNLHVSYP